MSVKGRTMNPRVLSMCHSAVDCSTEISSTSESYSSVTNTPPVCTRPAVAVSREAGCQSDGSAGANSAMTAASGGSTEVATMTCGKRWSPWLDVPRRRLRTLSASSSGVPGAGVGAKATGIGSVGGRRSMGCAGGGVASAAMWLNRPEDGMGWKAQGAAAAACTDLRVCAHGRTRDEQLRPSERAAAAAAAPWRAGALVRRGRVVLLLPLLGLAVHLRSRDCGHVHGS
jgi:hypothetical protein